MVGDNESFLVMFLYVELNKRPTGSLNTDLHFCTLTENSFGNNHALGSIFFLQFDLVCDQKNLPDFAQSSFFLGVLLGSVIYGTLSDL